MHVHRQGIGLKFPVKELEQRFVTFAFGNGLFALDQVFRFFAVMQFVFIFLDLDLFSDPPVAYIMTAVHTLLGLAHILLFSKKILARKYNRILNYVFFCVGTLVPMTWVSWNDSSLGLNRISLFKQTMAGTYSCNLFILMVCGFLFWESFLVNIGLFLIHVLCLWHHEHFWMQFILLTTVHLFVVAVNYQQEYFLRHQFLILAAWEDAAKNAEKKFSEQLERAMGKSSMAALQAARLRTEPDGSSMSPSSASPLLAPNLKRRDSIHWMPLSHSGPGMSPSVIAASTSGYVWNWTKYLLDGILLKVHSIEFRRKQKEEEYQQHQSQYNWVVLADLMMFLATWIILVVSKNAPGIRWFILLFPSIVMLVHIVMGRNALSPKHLFHLRLIYVFMSVLTPLGDPEAILNITLLTLYGVGLFFAAKPLFRIPFTVFSTTMPFVVPCIMLLLIFQFGSEARLVMILLINASICSLFIAYYCEITERHRFNLLCEWRKMSRAEDERVFKLLTNAAGALTFSVLDVMSSPSSSSSAATAASHY